MSPYYISEVIFKEGDVIVVIKNANDDSFTKTIRMYPKNFIDFEEWRDKK